MTTRVLLVRHAVHGLVDTVLCGRTPGVGLSPAGLHQAELIAETLAATSPAAVYSSPQRRAQETAAAIGRRCGIACNAAPALDEIDFGAWMGQSFVDLSGLPAWTQWNTARAHHRAPGGETMPEVQARVWDWLLRTCRDHAGHTVVAVSHGDVIKSALFMAMGLSLDLHHRVAVDPGSVSEIVARGGAFQAARINQQPFNQDSKA